MTKKLTPSMRLKVKRDTFFLPYENSGVYFRNNISSFRMEGNTIDKWVEKLIPMFNGEYTLGHLTEGLPAPYRKRVYEIAEALYRNGFVKDVSQELPHHLQSHVIKKYASQIEFLENFGDSGAYRFQAYRQSKVLAVGSGPFLVSLVSALLESGLPRFHVLITDQESTNRKRLYEHVEHARQTDPEVKVNELTHQKDDMSSWSEIVQEFQFILYVSEEGDVEKLRALNEICIKEKKGFLPAICLDHMGMGGPLVLPESKGCWESAWRSIHESALHKEQPASNYSQVAGAMLANVIVFELFKEMTRITESEKEVNQFFLLNLETLEGNWHSFIPHPLVTGFAEVRWIKDFDVRINDASSSGDVDKLFLLFNHLTSPETGILHIWEEGDLKQLPLSQCQVQAVNPLSEGPAKLLPDIVCAGLTHVEARREAGLTGIEAYVSHLFKTLLQQEVDKSIIEKNEFVGVGMGESLAESVCRGLQMCLVKELSEKNIEQKHAVSRIELKSLEDKHCQFYLQVLTRLNGAPFIGVGEKVSGFPVVWIRTNNRWYSGMGLTITKALENALQHAIMEIENREDFRTAYSYEDSSVLLEQNVPLILEIPSSEEMTHSEMLNSAIKVLERNSKQIMVFKLEIEPFNKNELVELHGVLLKKEEST
ncbi:putative thiazole-containing bacteriocin maturation protein [Bacillus sp. HNG]|uniref:putative thiazole-containing bacteriocin maturation protein n=1 Tax=Bacillus sp. HNG TaxID=2293325 RepID=UPI000E2F5729|nr:putative thiazole-containing bacteriocin maturation protein [Bacillus sp. HNG]RFB18933.1 putative thiazole-containing bacteriocin maturation protein [Bacillus sp. HNG]